jgi:ribokinase
VSITDNYCGEALGTAIVLKRLGIDVSLEGNWLGDNESGRRTLEFIRSRGIESSGIVIKPGYIGVDEFVISDQKSRTVFGRYEDLLFTDTQWEMPDEQKIENADIICCDPSFKDATEFVIRTTLKHGKKIVGIDSDYDSELNIYSNVMIVSEDYLKLKYPDLEYQDVFHRYLSNSTGLVIFTFGNKPVWFGRSNINKLETLRVNVVDTSGAGDAFRAGVAYGILNNFSDEFCVKFASAVATAAIQTYPGVINFPGLEKVNQILESQNLTLTD